MKALPRTFARLRYHWHHAFLHLLLIFLGLANLYPFFWMVGTSLKAEAEASTDRMSPLPGLKFRLAPGFALETVLPTALEPALTSELDALARRKHLQTLQKKLRLIDRMQREGRPHILRAFLDGQVRGLEFDVQTALDALKVLGILEEGADGAFRLRSDALKKAENPEIAERFHPLIDSVLDHFTVSPREYSQLAHVGLDASVHALQSLELLGVLEPLSGSDPAAEGKRYFLSPSATGPVLNQPTRLMPRHVLLLWSMQEENERRASSRATYADDRIAPADFFRGYGMASVGEALVELNQLAEHGLLARGTVQLMNYWVVLKGENLLLNVLTSVTITVLVVIGTVLISSMLGYALARLQFPGKFWVLGIMLLASVLPGEARIIPLFKMLMAVNGLETPWGMTMWMTSFGVGNALLMAGFFLSLPKEVNEAASVDGAGVFRTFFDIALPMARPIVMTVGMFAFLSAWNEFLVPLLCTISRPDMQPLAVAVYNFQAGHPGKWHEINAAASIMIVPVILLFLAVQKHVVKSIAVGAVKG